MFCFVVLCLLVYCIEIIALLVRLGSYIYKMIPALSVSAFLSWHRLQLQNRPYMTNSVTSAVLMLCGDRFAQYVENTSPDSVSVDPYSRTSLTRSSVLTVWSATASIAWTRYYFWMFKRWPGRVILWVTLTAVIPGPLMNAAFFYSTTFAEHLALHPRPFQSMDVCRDLIKRKFEIQFLPTIQRSALLWVPVNYLNFCFVPMEYRMLCGSSVSFLWNVYLSLVQHTDPQKQTSSILP